MPEAKPDSEPTLVEKWVQDQQQWQRTLLAYFDSMVKNDDFLVHLGNAMRGSLLAGKPYPTAPPAASPPADDRLDQVLFALNNLQGQLQDLLMTLEEISRGLNESPSPEPPRTARTKRAATAPQSASRKRRVR